MDELLYESLRRYFTGLENTGYRKQRDVDRLLILIMIIELLCGELFCFIDEDDKKVIDKALSCLYGSNCLIPYPNKYSKSVNYFIDNPCKVL